MWWHWGSIVRISQCQSFYLTWVLHYDLRCRVRFWEEIVFPHWLSILKSYASICLSWCFLCIFHWAVCHGLNVPVVVVVAAILKNENVNLLEVDVARMETDRVPLRKVSGNAGTVDVVITSPRNAERNLVDLSGHNYLSLILLLCVALLIYSSTSSAIFGPRLYWHRRSMIDFDS